MVLNVVNEQCICDILTYLCVCTCLGLRRLRWTALNSSVSTMPTRSFSNSSVWLASQNQLQSIITTSCGSCTPMLHWLTLRHTRLHQRPMFASSETATVSLSNSSQTVCLSTMSNLSVSCLPICFLYVYLSACLSVFVPACMPACFLSVYLSVCRTA